MADTTSMSLSPPSLAPEAAPDAPSTARTPQTALPLVLLVADGEAPRAQLSAEVAGRGMRVLMAGNLQDALVQIGREPPSVAVVDLALRNGALEIVSELAEQGILVVALGETASFEDRLTAARQGASAYLEPGSSASDVVDQVALAIERTAVAGSRVLLVDSDAHALEHACAVLASGGLEVHGSSHAGDLWETLNRVNPSLLLLAESAGGTELCRVLRNEPRWTAVPIVLVVDRLDPGTAARAFDSGADDFLVKPLADADLIARAQSLLARHRVHQALAETDALTGLANRRTSTARLGYMIRLASRLDRPVSIVEIDVDHFKSVNDRYGHMAGDAALRRLADVLRQSFGAEDVVARWGGEEFIVGMFGCDRNTAIDRVSDVLAAFRMEVFEADDRRFSLSFSAGVAQFPLDGDNLEGLYRAADSALYAAKAKGRNQVAAAASGAAQQVVDVALIEDDDGVADLLTHTLTQAGMSWWRFSNGASAAAQLTGKAPRLRARVILLDLSLPAFDGFEVLTLLQRDGMLESTRVIMLTGSDDEADRRRARELGASDYVTKPFHVDGLVGAVSEAMGRGAG